MAIKEGNIFIEVVCANCRAIIKNGWTYHSSENEKTTWNTSCPICKLPIKVEFTIN